MTREGDGMHSAAESLQVEVLQRVAEGHGRRVEDFTQHCHARVARLHLQIGVA